MPPVHPFKQWRESEGLDLDAAAERIRAALVAAGKRTQFSKPYLINIEGGWDEPGWPTCKAMEVVSGGRVSAQSVKDWRRPATAPAAKATAEAV